jgi:hypothetical protein
VQQKDGEGFTPRHPFAALPDDAQIKLSVCSENRGELQGSKRYRPLSFF